MSKKVLIISGSPRKGGNSDILCDRFREGAEAAGNTVEKVFLRSLKIGPCMACYGCRGKGVCVQKDDMVKIYPVYRDADVVVLASPMYYWGISGQLKTAFDRLFAVAELTPDYENPKKECVLLMAAEGDTESNFAPVRAFYEGLTSHLGWQDRGIVYAGGNMEAGDILSKMSQLEEAEALGRAIL